MDLHVPEEPIRSLKEFLLHILVVTIGILIAIAIEQAVESHNRARRAAEAVEGFRREIRENIAQVDDIMKAMPKLRDDIAAEIAKLSDPSSDNATPIHYPDFSVNFVSDASWEAAVATQALSDLPWDVVRRYSESFGVFRLFYQEERAAMEDWQALHAFGTDRAKLSAEDRRALIERLRRYDAYTYVIDTIAKGARASSERALADK